MNHRSRIKELEQDLSSLNKIRGDAAEILSKIDLIIEIKEKELDMLCEAIDMTKHED